MMRKSTQSLHLYLHFLSHSQVVSHFILQPEKKKEQSVNISPFDPVQNSTLVQVPSLLSQNSIQCLFMKRAEKRKYVYPVLCPFFNRKMLGK